MIETPRLLLRMFQESDWKELHEMLSDEECVRYTVKTPLTEWQSWRTLASYLGHWQLRGYGPYAVVEKASNKMIGPVGLWYPGDWPEPEIKYSLVHHAWGNGFASEAALAVKDMAKDALKRTRLISLILPDNTSSIAVCTKIGGRFEGTIPFRDGTADIYVYEL